MATSTLYLYKDARLKDKNNFSIDSISDYLPSFQIGSPITNYQYQRMTLYKKIKLNSDQINASVNYLLENNKPNYLMFVQDSATVGGVTKTCKYYYFIESITQLSEKTIELDLKMDVLNTFNYNTKGTDNTNYTLSDRSLITREHKDRWKSDILWKESSPTAEDIDRYETIRDYQTNDDSPISTSITMRLDNILDYMTSNSIVSILFYISDPITDPQDHPRFFIREMWGQGYYADHYDIETIFINGGIIHFEDENADDIFTIDLTSDDIYNKMVSIVMPAESTTNFTPYDLVDTWANTFTNLFSYNQIIRASKGYKRIIDQYEEGIDCITFKTGEREVIETRNQWYVVYRSANAVVDSPNATSPHYVNPVQVDFYSDNGYTYETRVASLKTIYAYDSQIPKIKNRGELLYIDLSQLPNGAYVRIAGTDYDNNGVTYTIGGTPYVFYHLWIRRKNNDDRVFISAYIDYAFEEISPWRQYLAYSIPSVSFYDIDSCAIYSCIDEGSDLQYVQQLSIGSGEVVSTSVSPKFEDIDITDPRLIKIIAFPYCPRSDLEQFQYLGAVSSELTFNASDYCFELVNPLKNGFNRNLGANNPFTVLYYDGDDFGTITDRKARNIIYESKLFHSDYYQVKFVYDSFTFLFRPEDMDINNYPIGDSWSIQYVCSGNVQSKFMFKFTDYVCKREVQDYNDVLIVERNNEKALFSNAYMDYIRSGGFRYDSKNADSQKLTNGLTIALTTVGSVASFVSSIWTGGVGIAGGVGLLVGTATKTVSAIHQAQQNDRQIAQKLLTVSQQSTSVSGSEDLDLLMAYSGNKAKYCYYEVSTYLKDALWDLFHYFGYKCQYYGIPKINTRCNFNFVQGEVVLKNYTFNDDIANEIIKKWKEGITFFHKGTGNTWDINQEYENFENTLLTEV